MLRLILLFTLSLFVTTGCSCSDDGEGQGDGTLPDLCADGTERQAVVACADDGEIYTCGNGCDDDRDGLADLDDADCASACADSEAPVLCADGSPMGAVVECEGGLVYACGNGCDDDQDGLVDLDDPECADSCGVSEAVGGGGGTGSIVPCDSKIYACGNGVDDDEDGLADADDPNCLGPCDNNESGYYPEIPGGISGAGGCTIDCYFDADSASGDTDCEWDVKCDPLNPGENWGGSSCAYNEANASIDCEASFDEQYAVRTGCQDNCEFRTPNGCDCFGCCAFPTDAEPDRHLLIGSRVDGTTNQFKCTYEEAIKPGGSEFCQACTPVDSCYKGCARCQLCLGKTELPDDCTPTEVGERCEEGQQTCGLEGDEPCDAGFYCLTGCCVYFGTPP